MKVAWHDAAVSEFGEAALHYGAIDDELGERFASATEVAVAQIKARPAQARKFDGLARKVRVRRFPLCRHLLGRDGRDPHPGCDASASRAGLLA
jgi:hypothetical protein